MQTWYHTTDDIPLMQRSDVGEVPPKTVLFLKTGASIPAGQDFPVGEPEIFLYGGKSVVMLPIYIEGRSNLYILETFADESQPHYRMKRITRT